MSKESNPPENGSDHPPVDRPLTRRELRLARKRQEDAARQASDGEHVPPPVPAYPPTQPRNELFDQEAFERQEREEAEEQRRNLEAEQAAEAEAAAEELRRRHREKDRILRHIREQNALWAMPPVETEEATRLPEEQLAETEAFQTTALQVIEAEKAGIVADPHELYEGYESIPLIPEPREEHVVNRRNRNRKKLLILGITAAVFMVAVVAVASIIQSFLSGTGVRDYPGPGGEQVDFTVDQGEGALSISNKLVNANVVASSQAFMQALEEDTSGREIQPGDYQMRSEMKASDALERLLEEPDKVHYIAIRPGLRIDAVFEEIADSTGLDIEDIEAAADDPTEYGLPSQARTLEGYLRPGEYRLPIDADPESILTEMTQATFTALEELGITDPDEQFRDLTIASLLVGEANPEDYERVAGIIENRLNPNNDETGGYLQIDATVIYGLGVQRLQFTQAEKEDASNEYNTYEHRGLPPGPIGAPSQSALEGVVNAEDNDYYYWVTVNIETGETKFAETYEEHRGYQAEYNEYCKENPDIC